MSKPSSGAMTLSAGSNKDRNKRKSMLLQPFKKPWRNSVNTNGPDLKREKASVCGFHRGSAYLPPIVEQTCSFLEQNALQQVGLFRISGSQEDVKHLKEKFDKGKKVILSKDLSADTVAGVLKLFFTELPNPVLTYELYASFMAALPIKDEILRMWCVKKVIDVLPPGNRVVIDRVCAMFQIISRLEESNKMSAKNIALVMSTSMFRDRDESAEQMLRTGGLRVRLLELLIRHHEDIFVSPMEVVEEKVKAVQESINLETDLQIQKFSSALQEGSIKLAASLVNEGETMINVKFDDSSPLKGPLDSLLSPRHSNEHVSNYSNNINATLPSRSRRQGIRCNRNDMENAFASITVPTSISSQPDFATISLPNLGELTGGLGLFSDSFGMEMKQQQDLLEQVREQLLHFPDGEDDDHTESGATAAGKKKSPTVDQRTMLLQMLEGNHSKYEEEEDDDDDDNDNDFIDDVDDTNDDVNDDINDHTAHSVTNVDTTDTGTDSVDNATRVDHESNDNNNNPIVLKKKLKARKMKGKAKSYSASSVVSNDGDSPTGSSSPKAPSSPFAKTKKRALENVNEQFSQSSDVLTKHYRSVKKKSKLTH